MKYSKRRVKRGKGIFDTIGKAQSILSDVHNIQGDWYNVANNPDNRTLAKRIGAVSSLVKHGADIAENVANLVGNGPQPQYNKMSWQNFIKEYRRRNPYERTIEATRKAMPMFKYAQQMHGSGIIDTVKQFFDNINPLSQIKKFLSPQTTPQLRRGALQFKGSY